MVCIKIHKHFFIPRVLCPEEMFFSKSVNAVEHWVILSTAGNREVIFWQSLSFRSSYLRKNIKISDLDRNEGIHLFLQIVTSK